MGDQKEITRRNILQAGLAGVAGLAAGYSLLPRAASAAEPVGSPLGVRPAGKPLAPADQLRGARSLSVATPNAKNLSVALPKLVLTGEGAGRRLSNQQEVLLNTIAPVLEGLIRQTGDQISPAQLTTLRGNILSKGRLSLPQGGNAASVTIGTLEV